MTKKRNLSRDRNILISLCLFFFLFAFLPHNNNSYAARNENTQTISTEAFLKSDAGRLLQAGKYEEALGALKDLQQEYPHDPLLMRYEAIALDRSGKSKEAIAIFKQLLKKDIDHLAIRYFLGQAYARAGKTKAALKEFHQVAAEGKGSTYGQWALKALDKVESVTEAAKSSASIQRWYIVARYGWEYDSNVKLRPNDESIVTDTDEKAGRQSLGLKVRYRAYSKKDTAVDLIYSTSQTFHDNSLNEFNFHSEEFGIHGRRRVDAWGKDVILGARYDLLVGFLEDDLFSNRSRWRLSADTQLSKRTRMIVYDNISVANYGPDGSEPAKTSRDGFYNEVGISHFWYSKNFKSYLFVTQELNNAQTRGQNFDEIGSTSRIGVHAPLGKKLKRFTVDASTGLNLGFYPNFSSISTFDQSRRRDINWDLYSALTYRVTDQLAVRGFYRYMSGENQNNFYDYDRQVGGVQLIYSVKL